MAVRDDFNQVVQDRVVGFWKNMTGIYLNIHAALAVRDDFSQVVLRVGFVKKTQGYIINIHAAFAVRDDLNQVVQDRVVWFLKK